MKIIQINTIERLIEGETITNIYGLGDDNNIYFWVPETQEWHLFG